MLEISSATAPNVKQMDVVENDILTGRPLDTLQGWVTLQAWGCEIAFHFLEFIIDIWGRSSPHLTATETQIRKQETPPTASYYLSYISLS